MKSLATLAASSGLVALSQAEINIPLMCLSQEQTYGRSNPDATSFDQ